METRKLQGDTQKQGTRTETQTRKIDRWVYPTYPLCLRKWRTGAERGGKDCAAGAGISVERGEEETATNKRRPSAPDDRTDLSA